MALLSICLAFVWFPLFLLNQFFLGKSSFNKAHHG